MHETKPVTVPRAFILFVTAKLKEDEQHFRESTPLHVKLSTELIRRKKKKKSSKKKKQLLNLFP